MSGGRRRNGNGETPDTTNDEELARALQEQYRVEEEFQRSQRGSNETSATREAAAPRSQRDPQTPPQSQALSSPRRTRSNHTQNQKRSREQGASSSRGGRSDTNTSNGRRDNNRSNQRRTPRSAPPPPPPPPPSSTPVESENAPSTEPRSEFAEAFYGRHRPQRTTDTTPSTENGYKPNNSSATAVTEDSANDDELAARLSQELSDEEYAKYLQRCEQARTTQLTNTLNIPPPTPPQTVEELRAEAAAQQARERRKSRCRRYLPTATFLVMVAIGLTVFFTVYDGNVDNLPDFPSLDDFWPDDDPYAGENDDPSSANKWSNSDNGPGLSLTILNALSNDWSDTFYTAVSDWDNPPPPNYDVLTLTTSTTPYESECRPVRGQMKVCNGEYGDTNWRGINEVLIRRGVILSSVAKMNDSYLRRAGDDQRQYTMCHEIGHGFGLPHTDEDFYNADLGNCMDYTSNPKNNLKPNKMNYDFLAELYGYEMNSVDDGRSVNDTGARNRKRYSGVPEEEEGDVGGGKRQRQITTLWNQQDPSEEQSTAYEDEGTSSEWNEFLLLVQASSISPNLDDILENALHHCDGKLPPNTRRDVQATPKYMRRKWRTLHKQEKGEAHELDLGNGYTYRLSVLH